MQRRRVAPLVSCLLAFLLAAIGIVAAGFAEFNLLGVPMLDARAMNPMRGWIGLAVSVAASVGLWLLLRRERQR